MANLHFYSLAHHEILPVNLKNLLGNLESMKDQLGRVIVVADPLHDERLGRPLWPTIKTTVEQVKNTLFPEVMTMDSHLALFKKYAEFEDK